MAHKRIYLSSLPTDFQELEQQLYEVVIGYVTDLHGNIPIDKMPNVLVGFYIGRVCENLIGIDLRRITLSRLLKKCRYTLTFDFIYDIKQRRLMQLPSDEGEQYLAFFKDFYEILTRYWRLDSEKQKVVDSILDMYTQSEALVTRTPLSSIIGGYCIYTKWKEHSQIFETAKTLLMHIQAR